MYHYAHVGLSYKHALVGTLLDELTALSLAYAFVLAVACGALHWACTGQQLPVHPPAVFGCKQNGIQ